jgi:hypothetical protein
VIFYESSARYNLVLSAERLRRRLKPAIPGLIYQPVRCASFLASWAESLIFSGTSAALMLIASFYQAYWYLSFVALAPFLYKIIRAGPREAARLGILLGAVYFGILFADSSLIPGPLTGLHWLGGVFFLGAFGWTIAAARERWGFNPAVIALLWAVVKLSADVSGIPDNSLWAAERGIPFLKGMGVVFGLVTISLCIILVNSILALVLARVMDQMKNPEKLEVDDRMDRSFYGIKAYPATGDYLIPDGRAPPSP